MSISPEARAFVESGRLGQIRSVWDGKNGVYDPVSDAYNSRKQQTVKTMAAEPTDHFMKVMQAFQKNFAEDPSIKDFNIRDCHGWEEVLGAAGKAQEKYKAKAKGVSGVFSKIGRKTGEASEAVMPFLNLLPQDSYTSIVYGGIVLVLKACKRMEKIRQKVMDTLADASRLFEEVEIFVRIYPQEPKLNTRVHHLYVALLAAIAGSVKWLGHRKWEPLKAFMQQGLYAKDYDDKVVFLKSCVDEVRHSAELCHQENSVKILEAVERQRAATCDLAQHVDTGFDEVRVDIHHFRSEVLESISWITAELMSELGDLKSEFGSHFGTITTHMENNSVSTSRQMQQGFDGVSTQITDMKSQMEQMMEEFVVKALTTVVQQLSADKKAMAWRIKEQEEESKAKDNEYANLKLQVEQQNRQIERARTSLPPPPSLSQLEALQLLGNIGSVGEADVTHYVRLTRLINPYPGLANVIISHQKFGPWFASANSQMLFVEPNVPLNKPSASSFVTATLAQTITQMPTPIPLIHFCRGPSGANSNADPAAYLMASLVSQLLSKREFDLIQWSTFANLHDHYANLQSWNLNYLCKFFTHLVNLLPYGTIFCLIDDFFHLEHCAHEDSLGVIIQCLSEVVQTSMARDRVVFKVMVMKPDNKGSVIHYAPTEDVVRIGSGAHTAHRGQSMTPKQQRFQMERARRKAGGGSWMDSSAFDPYGGSYGIM